jgi:hypothetical protein
LRHSGADADSVYRIKRRYISIKKHINVNVFWLDVSGGVKNDSKPT